MIKQVSPENLHRSSFDSSSDVLKEAYHKLRNGDTGQDQEVVPEAKAAAGARCGAGGKSAGGVRCGHWSLIL